MSTPIVTAGSGQDWENQLVAALDRPGSALTVARRCVDIAEVLAAASTGSVAAAVLAANLRRLDTDALARLAGDRVAVVGVYPVHDPRARARLERLGVPTVLADDAGPAALVTATRQAVDRVLRTGGAPGDFVRADLRRGLVEQSGGRDRDDERPIPPPPDGSVVAVWGPTGAPGRTTVAAGLAVACAAEGTSTLLIDADVYGGVIAGAFGLLDESPGLAGACRLASSGRLDGVELARLAWAVSPDLRMLTGIARADRWPEIRPSAIPLVLAQARSLAALTVVDCGFCLETDEELSFDTAAPRRNGATLAVLDAADVVIVVGSADPPGMERLIRALAELADVVPAASLRVVLNRVRRGAAAAGEAAAALARFTGTAVFAALPEDRAATDAAWRRGVAPNDAAPNSPLVAALRKLAVELAPLPSTAGTR